MNKKIISTLLAVMVAAALPATLLAYTTTDQADYSPGSVVTITGNNNDGAGYLAGETVNITVTAPYGQVNGNTIVADDGSFSWQFTLPSDSSAIGSYTYTTVGQTSHVTENGAFSDSANPSLNVTIVGNGTVTSSDSSITCSTGTTGTCSHTYSGGNPSVSLTATAALGYTFAGWSGDCTGTSPTCSSVHFQGNQTSNVTATFTLTPVKQNQTITFGALGGKTYGDADFGVSATASSGLTVAFNSQTTGVCTVSGSTVHIVTAGTCTIRASQAGDSNWNAAPNVDQSFTIAKATPTLSVTNSPVAYNGSGQSATVSASVAGVVSNVLTGGTVTKTNAGTYAVTANFVPTSTTNYNSLTGASAGNFVINQVSSTTTVTCPTSVVYNASTQTPCTVLVTRVADSSLTPTPTYLNNTNVGTASASYTYAGDINHTGSSDSKNFNITKANASCSISGYTGVYDALAHGATGTCTGVGGDGILGGLNLDISFTNVPGGTAHWTFSNPNYNSQSGDATITITPADPICSVSGSSSMYDGAPHGATGSCVGLGGDGTLSTLNLGASFTNVPGGSANWTFISSNPNYNNASGTVAITITQAPSTVTVTCPTSTVYTGLAQTPCTAQATGVVMIPVDVTGSIVYGNNTNAGAATANASWAGDINHSGSVGSGGFTINPAALTITANNQSKLQGATFIFTGTEFTTIGLVNGETITKIILTSTGSAPSAPAPGTYPIVPGALVTGTANLSNYLVTPVNGTMTVYTLQSVFHGFFNPISTTLKSFQQGSTIPVKFALAPAGGANFYGGVATLTIKDGLTTVLAVSSGGSNTGNIFRYDPIAGQYIYNLSTKALGFIAGHTYTLTVTLNGISPTIADGTITLK